MTLRNTIESLAHDFAAGVLQAIRGASLEELLAESQARSDSARGRVAKPSRAAAAPAAKAPASNGRLVRRSSKDIEHVIGLIVGALGRAPAGMRSEELQKVLKISKKEIVRPLTEAVAAKRISKKGQKRATTYFAK
jgi:hypothetical protein